MLLLFLCYFCLELFELVMATNYSVLNYTINSLVEKTMKKFNCDYESALQAILNSKMYERLLKDANFLEEGDIYLFDVLCKEIQP